MTHLTFVRHGETEWNLQGRVMGHLDSALTPTGVEQARRLAARLRGTEFNAIYTSDLGRAEATAAILGEGRPGEARRDPRLRERRMGLFEGLTVPEMRERMPCERAEYERLGAENFVGLEIESVRDHAARVWACARELAERHAGDRVLVVTHGGTLTALFLEVFGLSYAQAQKARRPNAGVSVFGCEDGRWSMETWGDTAHLEGLRSLDDPINGFRKSDR
jgi:probable phosphoglycerate mutase